MFSITGLNNPSGKGLLHSISRFYPILANSWEHLLEPEREYFVHEHCDSILQHEQSAIEIPILGCQLHTSFIKVSWLAIQGRKNFACRIPNKVAGICLTVIQKQLPCQSFGSYGNLIFDYPLRTDWESRTFQVSDLSFRKRDLMPACWAELEHLDWWQARIDGNSQRMRQHCIVSRVKNCNWF